LTIEHIAQELEYPAAWVQSVRRRLLLLDPGGCGAVSLQECLLAQVQIPSSVAGQVLSRCFTELENRDYRKVMKKLAIAPEDLSFALAQISRLEPVPARRHSISHEQTRTVVPDARIVKSGAEWVVLLNDDGLPKLRLSPLYKQQLKKKESSQTLQFVRAKVKSALWLIRCIHQRQNTLVKTITSIVRHQRAWFDGAPSLRPLVLKDIANDIAMHESTVSRATSGKWVETPRGIVELRYFFNSSESVRAAIKQIISQENRTAPLSDQEIVQTLTSQGITLARRTATKYRKQLGIGSKTDRRRAF
jgi:RNA polymerase sigma-54 factor